MAQGNAFVADASDASAIFYNPAGINRFKTPQFYQGLFLNHPDRDFSGSGETAETNHRWFRSMTIYFATPVNERVSVGIGFFSPFGLGTAWPPTWVGRYISTFSKLQTYNLNPAISVKLLDNLSLAAGLDLLWSSVEIKRKVPVVVGRRQFPDAEVDLTGDGNGYGYNLGMLYEPICGVKLGVSYRSDIFVHHSGSLSTQLPSPLPPQQTDSGSASVDYPASVTMGISSSQLKPLTLEFDTTWTGWSSYEQLKVNVNAPISVNGVLTNTVVAPKNWHDAWAFRFGAN